MFVFKECSGLMSLADKAVADQQEFTVCDGLQRPSLHAFIFLYVQFMLVNLPQFIFERYGGLMSSVD